LLGLSSSNSNEEENAGLQFNNACNGHQYKISWGPGPCADASSCSFDQNAWANSVLNSNPVPINFNLTDISSLLTGKHFPHDDNIKQKRSHVQRAIVEYCSMSNICKAPPPPGTCTPPPAGAHSAITRGVQSQYMWTDQIQYGCKAGWKTTGGSVVGICNGQGQWIGSGGGALSPLQCNSGPWYRIKQVGSTDASGYCLQACKKGSPSCPGNSIINTLWQTCVGSTDTNSNGQLWLSSVGFPGNENFRQYWSYGTGGCGALNMYLLGLGPDSRVSADGVCSSPSSCSSCEEINGSNNCDNYCPQYWAIYNGPNGENYLQNAKWFNAVNSCNSGGIGTCGANINTCKKSNVQGFCDIQLDPVVF